MVREGRQEFSDWVTLLFFLVTAITVVIFIDVARKWPPLMEKWTDLDLAMGSYSFPSGLRKKLKLVTVAILGAAIVEHALFIAVVFKSCGRGDSFMDSMDRYFQFRFDYVFTLITYNAVWGVFFQILNLFSTISWNFMDLFIILMSLCLFSRFKQVSQNIHFLTTKHVADEYVWRKVRQDYAHLILLCEALDGVMSSIVMVSFGNNIFVVLVQLFNTLQNPPRYGVLDKTYYVYSFAFLITRISAVALYAANINSESKKPRYYLNTLPHYVYNVEIERLLYQTKFNTAALTGHKVFRVTRSLILRITVAIVSYELVLVQYLRLKGK
ncbi:hypothetical protein MTP99_010530 [Tenebrio molitor]|nr:hypothetical protein MTP99_010530 [Tenebrio molitor]